MAIAIGIPLFIRSLVTGEGFPNTRIPGARKSLVLMIATVTIFNGVMAIFLLKPCDPLTEFCSQASLHEGLLERALNLWNSFWIIFCGTYGVGLFAIIGMIGIDANLKPEQNQEMS